MGITKNLSKKMKEYMRGDIGFNLYSCPWLDKR